MPLIGMFSAWFFSDKIFFSDSPLEHRWNRAFLDIRTFEGWIRSLFWARKILSGNTDKDVKWIYISLKKEDRSGMKRGRCRDISVWLV